MWLRAAFLVPLVAFAPALTQDCGGEDPPDPPTTDVERLDQLLTDLSTAAQADKQGLVDDFFQEVAWSGGFPMIEGNSVTFVYQASDLTGPIRVAGDFNNWNATQYPMDVSPDFPLYFLTVDVADAGARSLYKFIGKSGGSDVYVADPHARRLQWDSFGQYSLIAGGPEASHIERWPGFYSEQLQNSRDMFVYVPAGYEEGSDYLPVLYMHDGQNLYDPAAFWGGWQSDDVADQLIRTGQISPVLMVGLANTYDRMDEYTQAEDYLPAQGGLMGGDGVLYAEWIVETVMPEIESRYRVRLDAPSTGVLGSSLGGLISYYIGWLYPGDFGFVGGMSSTFGWGKINLDNETVIEMWGRTAKSDQIMYIDSGGGAVGSCAIDTDGDGIWDDNSSAGDNYCETLQMKTVLESKGWVDGDDLTYVFAPGAEHNEAEWHERMDEALEAFVGR